MAEAVAATCIAEEDLLEQYGPLNKKAKDKTETTSLISSKPTQNQNN